MMVRYLIIEKTRAAELRGCSTVLGFSRRPGFTSRLWGASYVPEGKGEGAWRKGRTVDATKLDLTPCGRSRMFQRAKTMASMSLGNLQGGRVGALSRAPSMGLRPREAQGGRQYPTSASLAQECRAH
jgi:hypothetical protein